MTVRSGTAWLDVQRYLDNLGRSINVKRASSPFTIGGSISVNCHGEDPRFGTIGSTVKSIRVMLADGQIVRCSPNENEDLFHHVIGGYGLFGVMLNAELETSPNQMYTQKYQTVKTTQLPGRHQQRSHRQPEQASLRLGAVDGAELPAGSSDRVDVRSHRREDAMSGNAGMRMRRGFTC